MAPRASVPEALTRGPFTAAEARRAGLSARQLQGAQCRRLRRGVYIWTRGSLGPLQRLQAVAKTLPGEAAFYGRTAAWLHGLDVPACDPIEVAVPRALGITTRSGVAVHRPYLRPDEINLRHGLRVTSPLRTLADAVRGQDLVEAVVLLDSALHRQLIALSDLRTDPQLRRFATWVEPAAESPMESRLRILLVRAGLPRPIAQAVLRDEAGRPLARVDLYYPSVRLVIEYDGSTHRDSLVQDNRRQNALLQAGYRLLRFTAADVLGSPDAVVARVSAVLAMR